jgi:hypothetical protein
VLADVIALALQKRVELRYVDGHEMARDLTMIATRHSTAPTDGRSATVHEVAQSQQGSVGNAGGRSSFVHNDRA